MKSLFKARASISSPPKIFFGGVCQMRGSEPLYLMRRKSYLLRKGVKSHDNNSEEVESFVRFPAFAVRRSGISSHSDTRQDGRQSGVFEPTSGFGRVSYGHIDLL